jgi:Zn-dependent peptidase ImmA (M78 family)
MSKLAHSHQPTMDQIEARNVLDDYQSMDQEATAFAMELLMPTKMLRAELAKIPPIDIDDFEAIEKLARKFNVGRQVMFLRLTAFPR